jgi:hypothetical protein
MTDKGLWIPWDIPLDESAGFAGLIFVKTAPIFQDELSVFSAPSPRAVRASQLGIHMW